MFTVARPIAMADKSTAKFDSRASGVALQASVFAESHAGQDA